MTKNNTKSPPAVHKGNKENKIQNVQKQTKILFNQKRNTTINQQPGTNTLNIASLNPDFFTTNAIQQDIINQLTQQNTYSIHSRNPHTKQPLLRKIQLQNNHIWSNTNRNM